MSIKEQNPFKKRNEIMKEITNNSISHNSSYLKIQNKISDNTSQRFTKTPENERIKKTKLKKNNKVTKENIMVIYLFIIVKMYKEIKNIKYEKIA